MRFRPRFAQKVTTGVIQLPWAWYLSWAGFTSTLSMGLKGTAPRCYSSIATVTARPTGPLGRSVTAQDLTKDLASLDSHERASPHPRGPRSSTPWAAKLRERWAARSKGSTHMALRNGEMIVPRPGWIVVGDGSTRLLRGRRGPTTSPNVINRERSDECHAET